MQKIGTRKHITCAAFPHPRTLDALHTRPPAVVPLGVQTERASHEAWSRLVIRKPMAAAVLHTLVARMGDQNAVVVSQKTLAALIGVTDRTIRNAIQVLVAENWVQVVRLNGPGTVSAYVVNSAVAWGQPRDQLHLAAFTAAVIADAADQEAITLEHRDLRKIPMLYPGSASFRLAPAKIHRASPPSREWSRIFRAYRPSWRSAASNDYWRNDAMSLPLPPSSGPCNPMTSWCSSRASPSSRRRKKPPDWWPKAAPPTGAGGLRQQPVSALFQTYRL